MKRLFFLLCTVAFCSVSFAQFPVKNVIYIVGDGMGPAHVTASLVSQKGKSQFLRFPVSGFSQTYSLDSYTTDSGAGGTALMTGNKVQNQHIALSPNGVGYQSILFRAHQMGKSTGFVVTSDVLDATPASTYAHVANRHQYDSISLQMSQCPFNVMIGGGYDFFVQKKRKDGMAPLDTLKRRGYYVAKTFAEMNKYNGDKLCALLTDGKPVGAPAREPILTEGVKKALDILSRNDSNGFFLMVEGSHIDKANHVNDSAQLTAELAEFEQMLAIVLDFAAKDGKTLVVLTADHESGGLVLLDGSIEQGVNNYQFNTTNHSATMVPVFAFGPQARQFTGIHQNTEIHDIILKLITQKPARKGLRSAGDSSVKPTPRRMRSRSGDNDSTAHIMPIKLVK